MNSSKMTKVIKSSVYKKVTKSLEANLKGADINKILLLIYSHKDLKVTPFNFNEYKQKYLQETETEGLVFSKILDKHTTSIERNFNKSRKITRLFKDLYVNQKENLLKCLVSEEILQSLVCVYFISPEVLERMGLAKQKECLELLEDMDSIIKLQKYLSCLMATDILLMSSQAKELIELSIISNTDSFLDDMYELVKKL